MRRSSGYVLLVLVLIAAAGCGKTRKDHTEDLLRSSMRYQEGLRWSRFEDAAVLRPPPEREAFLDERDELSEDLKIDEYEVLRVHVTGEQRQARVQVKYTWHLDSVGVVHETVADQHWERHEHGWMLLDEWYKRGKKMPGLPDDPRPTTPIDGKDGRDGADDRPRMDLAPAADEAGGAPASPAPTDAPGGEADPGADPGARQD
jgi:hypothetical protein